MKLDVGGWRTVEDPSEAQIREAIRELDDFEGFLVLSSGDLSYIQSSGDSRVGFDLEYQEGRLIITIERGSTISMPIQSLRSFPPMQRTMMDGETA